ncbi:MAG: ABC transporter ATP-binding protein/permease [Sulfuriflexus sp.]|nr:ABC transporter ATP-binding protein/permease [Sulfuriflexus sp.]
MFHGRATSLPSQERDDMKTIRSLTPYLWSWRGRVGAALLALIMAKGANVAIPLLLKGIIDSLNSDSSEPLVLPIMLLLGYGALRMGSSLFNELRDAIFARVRHGAMTKVSKHVLAHLHNLSLRFHLDRKTGAITRDIDRGTRAVSSLLNYLVFSILPTLIEIAMITGILLWQYDIWFTIITFVSVGMYMVFTFKITEWRMQFRIKMNETDSHANTIAVDSLINYETVKYFGNEEYENRRYSETMSQWEDAAVKSQTTMSALNVGQSIIIASAVTMIMILASQGVVDGNMTLGDLVLVNAFLIQLFIPLGFLGIVYSQLKHALSDMDLMFKIIDERSEINDKADATELQVGEGEIRFEHVGFSYNKERTILDDVDFTIQAGQKIAVVGESGAGKSTLSRLLFRFYDVTKGRVTINGQDIRDVSQHSLRQAIGIVPQDTVMFNDTLYYNIAYAKPDATRDEIIRAAELAHIDHFIQSLPDGYDTMVGERGLKLSGGEKQRVAIARTILKNPKILVFDEATSSLDSKSEQVILDSLKEVAENHTTLVIAHRLSTIVDADRILVMDKGHIIEQGTHQELLAINKHYANMWNLQQKQLAADD